MGVEEALRCPFLRGMRRDWLEVELWLFKSFASDGEKITRLIILTMVALPATSIRKAIWTASDFSMWPGRS